MAYISFQTFLFTVLFVQSAIGLKCYICNSANDPACSMSPPPAKLLQECSQDTLEILNDMHRQNKLEDASQQAAQLNGTNMAPVPVAVQPGNIDPAAVPKPPPSHPFDKDDKDLTLNRTSRGIEDNSNSSMNPAKPFTTTMDIPKEATFCRKTSYHIPEQTNGPNSTLKATIRVIRSCGWIPETNKEGDQVTKSGCKWIGTEGVQMDQCVCTGDGCNSGNYMGSLGSQTLILLAVMTAGYFYVL